MITFVIMFGEMTSSKRPLADRMRPVSLDEIVGQDHLVGKNSVLRKVLSSESVPSIIFWGPPGSGKTTLAFIIAENSKIPYIALSAVSAGVKEVRDVISHARKTGRTILFIDEIHRFNKSQQDALLGAVEKGIITLIGATTENPSFEVNAALLSRCQVYILKSLSKQNLIDLLKTTLKRDQSLKSKKIKLKETEALLRLSGGDARKLLNLLELVAEGIEGNNHQITDAQVMLVAQRKIALYDKAGEQHYDIISAFIKSLRGSDPNAAVYYLARMIEGGEDVKFIARRMLILASEDIGNANPTALIMANNCFQAVNVIGYPEAEIILSQCAIYLACSQKSNASYLAIKKARSQVAQTGDLQVPLHLRNAPTKLMEDQGYSKDYKYAHDYDHNFIVEEYLPEEIAGAKFYSPGKNSREEEMRKRLNLLWKDKYDY